jgi:hypothetical protein
VSEQYRQNYDRIFRGKRPRNAKRPEYECILIPRPPIVLKPETGVLEFYEYIMESISCDKRTEK